jgi:hypothetical protein
VTKLFYCPENCHFKLNQLFLLGEFSAFERQFDASYLLTVLPVHLEPLRFQTELSQPQDPGDFGP